MVSGGLKIETTPAKGNWLIASEVQLLRQPAHKALRTQLTHPLQATLSPGVGTLQILQHLALTSLSLPATRVELKQCLTAFLVHLTLLSQEVKERHLVGSKPSMLDVMLVSQ